MAGGPGSWQHQLEGVKSRMIVPRFWAEARVQKRTRRQQITIRRFGWSDDSPEDAQQHADRRAAEALTAAELGSSIFRREPKRSYNGADGVPIREEIVQQVGTSIVTRNSYGARCLNTPDVLFADIDLEVRPPVILISGAALVVAGTILAALWGQTHWAITGISTIVALIVMWWIAALLYRRWIDFRGGPERIVLGRLTKFLEANRDWKIRVYRTPAGLRLLAVHRRFSPQEPIVAKFFAAVGTDPVYVRMCLKQNCFRARLTAKPWRIGIQERIKPRRGTWPVPEEKRADRTAWINKYERTAQNFAACQYIDTIGTGSTDPTAHSVQELHDRICQSHKALTLA